MELALTKFTRFADSKIVNAQTQEMDLVRQTVFQLEAAHATMKQKYVSLSI